MHSGQALFHSCQMRRIEVEILHVAAQFGPGFPDLDQGGIEQFADRTEMGIQPVQGVQFAQALVKAVGDGVLVTFDQPSQHALAGFQ